jgi:ribosomal 50S subunit-recycling heat shock protein
MRLDKFLKVSRLIKRRTVANDACDNARINVNGKPAKASHSVKVGDEITVSFGSKNVTVKVLDIRDTTKKSESQGMYEVISETDA